MRRSWATLFLFRRVNRRSWRQLIQFWQRLQAAAILTACSILAHTMLFFVAVRSDLGWDRWLNVLAAWPGPMIGLLVSFCACLEIPASVRRFQPGLTTTCCHALIVIAVTYTLEVMADDSTLMVTPLGLEPRLDYVYQQPGFMALWWLLAVTLSMIVQLWSKRRTR